MDTEESSSVPAGAAAAALTRPEPDGRCAGTRAAGAPPGGGAKERCVQKRGSRGRHACRKVGAQRGGDSPEGLAPRVPAAEVGAHARERVQR
jgi:hypothetical protein